MFAVINKENNDLGREGYQPHAPDGEGLEGESDEPETQSKSRTEKELKPGSFLLSPPFSSREGVQGWKTSSRS